MPCFAMELSFPGGILSLGAPPWAKILSQHAPFVWLLEHAQEAKCICLIWDYCFVYSFLINFFQ